MSGVVWGVVVVLVGLELGLARFNWLWRWRRGVAAGLMLAWVVALLLVVSQFHQALALWLFGYVVVFCLFNLARVVYGRTKELYLRRVFGRTSQWLGLYLILTVPLLYGWPKGEIVVYVILGLQLAGALLLALSTFMSISRSRIKLAEPASMPADLPTVSVAIPARNETDELVECLRAVVASDYSRLEVIVLDDCSQQSTSDVIRSFAQHGVRFIPGDPPREGWLAKNQAYDILTQHASGDLVLFCGADTRFDPHTIRRLVELYLTEKLTMLTIMPFWPQSVWRWSIIQPLRFWWELALPRFAMRQPASLSSCWLVDRRWVLKLGGFKAVSNDVRPERFFAQAAAHLGQYQFKISPPELGVTSHKQPGEQFDTAIRLRYPELHRRPESVLALSLFIIVFLVWPFLELIVGLVIKQWWLVALPAVTVCLLTVTHLQIMRISSRQRLGFGLFGFPLIATTEFILISLSMYRYEFSTVQWKGRNICLPVMHIKDKRF